MAELTTSTEIALADIGGAEYVPIREDATPGLLHLTLNRLKTWLFGTAFSIDTTNGNVTTGGTFMSQGSFPGFWLDETDGAIKGAYVVLDGGIFQIQRRAAAFGAYEAGPVAIAITAPSSSFVVNSDGTVDFGFATRVPDDAYDATTWDGNLSVPTKNAVRDKIEALSAGGGGSLTLISEQVASGSSTTLTVSSIPNTYRQLVLEFYGRSGGAMLVRCNNDSSSLYSSERVYSGAAFASGESTLQSSFNNLPDASTGGAAVAAMVKMEFPNYNDTTFNKLARWQGRQPADANGDSAYQMTGSAQYKSTSAISRLDVISSSGNWVAGSTMRVYGIS